MDRKQIKRLFALALLSLTFATGGGQTLLDAIPSDRLPLLRPELRRALAERYLGGQHPAIIQNDLAGDCVLDSLSADYLLLYPTRANKLEARRIGSDVWVIATTIDPGADSHLLRYDSTGTSIPLGIALPTATDFYQPSDSLSLEGFLSLALPFVVGYRFDADTLVATYQPRPYLPDEDYARLSPALRRLPVRIPIP